MISGFEYGANETCIIVEFCVAQIKLPFHTAQNPSRAQISIARVFIL